MKRPIKPPTPPPAPPTPSPDGPTSGRARKEVSYAARPAPALPSTRSHADAEYDLVEDLATPIKAGHMVPDRRPPRPPGPIGAERMPDDTAATPIKAAPLVAPLFDPVTGPSPPSARDMAPRPEAPTGHWEPGGSGPLPTGPIQPIPPPSYRGPATFSPPQSSQHSINAASSGRVRQVTPMDNAAYGSQPGPISGPISGPHITGPQMPVMPQHRPPGSTGPFPTMGHVGPTAVSMPPSSRRPGGEEGLPLGYVVASAFFLAIAVVGFGLYLAFEVISL